MNLIDAVLLLPHRARWHLARWKNLSPRERRRLRRRPTLLAQQRAWVAAWPARANRIMKRVYGDHVSSLFPPDSPLLRMTFSDRPLTYSTSK